MKLIKTGVLALFALTLSGQMAYSAPLKAVASFSVLGDMVRQIGGDRVEVTTLVGPDGDPHTFEPSPADSVTLKNSRVVFISGLGLEGWMNRLIRASGFHGTQVLASEGVSSRTMREDGHVITDPHAWNSAANGIIYARNITRALATASPENAAWFEARGKAYEAELGQLDTWAKGIFAAIPESKREVLTSHDAFGYFGERYGVRFLAPVGFSTEAEASAGDVMNLITQIRQLNIHSYFIENQTDPRLVRQIASATGARPGGELYPEALSKSGGPAATYADAFRHNVIAISNAMKQ
ncbi:metal ABC transporter substrate-binding protein [Salmonella enterica subsp. enterica serovar Choleraesuis]|nr:metal ABC transporter substrate-binding protein [Salmonella enterica subsp. enterica serovar Choleraesuis]